jgi:hypothetical protein
LASLEFMASLNQRVPGSSPGAPTNLLNHLQQSISERTEHGLHLGLQFSSCFELHHRDLGELHVAASCDDVSANAATQRSSAISREQFSLEPTYRNQSARS